MSVKFWTPPPVLNVGVLGHVDSGKTSLCAALSTVLSTAALDKSPQSAQRGITLDLQFSAFTLPLLAEESEQQQQQQQQKLPQREVLVTLVDCPGHASLIRTIIGGCDILLDTVSRRRRNFSDVFVFSTLTSHFSFSF
jgi:selenocysteine-specific elongation factor